MTEAKVEIFHEEILRVCREFGPFLVAKNQAYGDATRVIVRCLAELYPSGIPVNQIGNAYYMIQILNKLCRVATHNPADGDPMGEIPWQDTAGYAILAQAKAITGK